MVVQGLKRKKKSLAEWQSYCSQFLFLGRLWGGLDSGKETCKEPA